jgi:hypothetical protein
MVSTANELFINSLNIKQEDLKNKLFCTFSSKEGLDKTIETIKGEYTVAYNKIFVLESVDSDEYLCTYNIEVVGNTTAILRNTILLHRKKETNTLYTINSLNALIKSLNGGALDTSFQINWKDYRNSVLLTTGNDVRRLNTTVYKIISL